MAAANGLGIAFLASLLIFATYNDVMRLRASHAQPAAVHSEK
jgi:hypothetical protein